MAMVTSAERSFVADLGALVGVLRADARDLDPAALAAAVALGTANGLAVPLRRALADSPLRDRLPAAALDALAARHAQQVERTATLVRELEVLAERFSAAGLPFLLLKGPYLAARFYGDVLGREFVDIDLLVPEAERRRAAALLRAAGYRRRSRVVLAEAPTAFFVHAFDYGNGSTTVDLHWCLSRHPSFRVSEDAVWKAHGSWTVAGRPYDVLSDEHEVLFGVLSILRDVERGRPKLKGLVDLVQVLERLDGALEWPAFFAARRTDGTYGPAVNVLALCLDATGRRMHVPRLAAAVDAAERRRIVAVAPELVLRPTRLGLASKRWCAAVYDGTPRAWLAWWAVSFPFRVAVHERPLHERLRKRARRVWRPVRREGRRAWRVMRKRLAAR